MNAPQGPAHMQRAPTGARSPLSGGMKRGGGRSSHVCAAASHLRAQLPHFEAGLGWVLDKVKRTALFLAVVAQFDCDGRRAGRGCQVRRVPSKHGPRGGSSGGKSGLVLPNTQAACRASTQLTDVPRHQLLAVVQLAALCAGGLVVCCRRQSAAGGEKQRDHCHPCKRWWHGGSVVIGIVLPRWVHAAAGRPGKPAGPPLTWTGPLLRADQRHCARPTR